MSPQSNGSFRVNSIEILRDDPESTRLVEKTLSAAANWTRQAQESSRQVLLAVTAHLSNPSNGQNLRSSEKEDILASLRLTCDLYDQMAIMNAYTVEIYRSEQELVEERLLYEQCLDQLQAFRAATHRNGWTQALHQVKKILPASVAEVNIASEAVDIPSVSKWQKQKQIPHGVADTEYLRLTAEARRRIEHDIMEASAEEDTDLGESVEIGEIQRVVSDTLLGELASIQSKVAGNRFMRDAKMLLMPSNSFNSQPKAIPIPDRRQTQLLLRTIKEFNDSRRKPLNDTFLQNLSHKAAHEIRAMLLPEWQQVVADSFDDIVIKHLAELQKQLHEYTWSADAPQTSDVFQTKKNTNFPTALPAVSEQEVSLSAVEVPIDPHFLPWLDEDDVRNIKIIDQDGRRVGLVDGRDEKSMRLEQESFDHSLGGELADAVRRRLDVVVKRAASDEFDKIPRLRNVDKARYPYPIHCPKVIAPNAIRSYFSQIRTENYTGANAEQLAAHDVDVIVIWIGSCTKKRQVEMLMQLTTNDRNALRKMRVGTS